jgi:hypothetical protein
VNPPIRHRDQVSEPTRGWLIFRRQDGSQAFGEIIEEDRVRYVVDQNGQPEELEKTRKGQWRVSADSLELLRLREPDSLARRFDEDPVATIVTVLADRRVSRTKDQLVEHLKWLGVEIDDKTWKSLQPKLAKHPNIQRSGSPVAYAWREATVAEEGPDELLAKALSPKATKEGADQARAALTELSRADKLSVTQRALAVIAGADAVSMPAWHMITLDGLEERPADLLLERAASDHAWAFLAEVALDPGRPARAARAAELLGEAPAEQRDAHVAKLLRALASEIPDGAELPPYLELIERRQPLVDRVLGERATQLALEGLLTLAFAVPRGTSAEAAGRVRSRALLTAARVASSRAALTSAVEAVHPSASQRSSLRQTLETEPLTSDGPRVRWLAALSRWQPTAPELHEGAGWWTGLDLDSLPIVSEDEDLSPIIRSQLGRQKVLRVAIERSLDAAPSSLARVLALPDSLLSLVSSDVILEAAKELPKASALSRVIEALGGMGKAEAERQHRAELEAIHARFEENAESLRQSVAESAELAALAASRRDALARELDEVRDHQISTTEAHRRQAQLEALRALAELLHEARSALAAVAAGTIAVGDIDSRMARLAGEAGVDEDAAVNSEIQFNRALYRPIGEDPGDGAFVRVIEPAYITRTGGSVTALRYGSVVPVDPG